MITQDQILYYLNQDTWFTPNNSERIEITAPNGDKIQVSKSYYHNYGDDPISSVEIKVRVSNHGTYLDTWVRHRDNPEQSLQNLSVVFSNEPLTFKRKTRPVRIFNYTTNKVELKYLYFVVEQYQYRLDNLGMNDFNNVIREIKQLNLNHVFTDPLKKKPNKRAKRDVLIPTDLEGNDVPSSANTVHPRQTVVATHTENEVDAQGNVIPRRLNSDYERLGEIITEVLNDFLRREFLIA